MGKNILNYKTILSSNTTLQEKCSGKVFVTSYESPIARYYLFNIT